MTLLNRFAVTLDGAEVRVPSAGQKLVALAALQGPLLRLNAAALLWPHLTHPHAAASMRTALSRLRAACPALLLDDHTWLRLHPETEVDAHELEAEAVARTGVDDGIADEASLRRFTVELLPAWDEDWVLYERDRLRELCLHAIEARARLLAESRQFAAAINAAYAAIRMDPYRESPVRALIEIHLSEGNRAQAARCYVEFRRRLLAALRMEPSAEMRALVAPLIAEGRR